MSIDNLILFDDKASKTEYDPDTFRAGVVSLKEKMDAKMPNEDIRGALLLLKASMHAHPEIVREILPEDIGQMTRAIKSISNVVLVKDTVKQNKKAASGNISRTKLAELINKPPEDF